MKTKYSYSALGPLLRNSKVNIAVLEFYREASKILINKYNVGICSVWFGLALMFLNTRP